MDNKQEQLIRDRIREAEQHAAVPGFDPGAAWDKLEQQLDRPARKKIPLYYQAAAAGLLLLVAVALWWPAAQPGNTPVARIPERLNTKPPVSLPAPVKDQDPVTAAPVRQQAATSLPRSSAGPQPLRDTIRNIAAAQQDTPASVPEPAPKSTIASVTDQRILKRAMPQVSLAELLQDDATELAPPRKDEPTLRIGIRKTAKVLLNEPGPAVAQHAIIIKL